MNHQHPKPPGCALKMQISKLDSRPAELGDGVLDSEFFLRNSQSDLDAHAGLGIYSEYPEKGPGLPCQPGLASEPGSTTHTSRTTARMQKAPTTGSSVAVSHESQHALSVDLVIYPGEMTARSPDDLYTNGPSSPRMESAGSLSPGE